MHCRTSLTTPFTKKTIAFSDVTGSLAYLLCDSVNEMFELLVAKLAAHMFQPVSKPLLKGQRSHANCNDT